MANDTHYLDEPLIEDVLKAPYFFNGRLLTQEDLTQEQTAQRARRKHLGRALGSGIAYGLEVRWNEGASDSDGVVFDVSAGLAIAPDGDTLHLPELQSVKFSARPGASVDSTGAVASDFSDCQTAITTVSVTTTGLHLLVIRAAAGRQGLASVSGLGNEAAPCNIKYRTAGVSFRAVPVPISSRVVYDPSDVRFRNAVALDCFGFFDDPLQKVLADPFNKPSPLEPAAQSGTKTSGYGKIDELRGNTTLCDCDLPLAIVNLKDNRSFDFVDMWPVRRPLLRPALSAHFWPFGGSDDRRRAESEAAMLCFQDQLATSRVPIQGSAATKLFSFLPGGGFLPFTSESDVKAFLGEGANRVSDADVGRLRWLIEESWRCEPIKLDGAMPPLTYFIFAGASNSVFFLRRRTDVDIELQATPEATGSGGLLAIVTDAWMRKNGDPDVALQRDGKPIEKPLDELTDDDAKRSALAKAGLDQRGLNILGLKKAKELPTIPFGKARFFLASKLSAGKYVVVVNTSEGQKPFQEAVNVSAHGVLAVLIN